MSNMSGLNPVTSKLAFLGGHGRRLISHLLGGRIGKHPWQDDWTNFWAVALSSSNHRGTCPVCRYSGPFLCHAGRPRQICPTCGSRARHRVLHLALKQWESTHGPLAGLRCLHIASEAPIAEFLSSRFASYLQADLAAKGQDVALDLTEIPLPDGSTDLLLASHVLEHILDDRKALSEIHRVLRDSGVAILSVPITTEKTVEFGYVDAARNEHTRECGPDYLQRYQEAGFVVFHYTSEDFDQVHEYALNTIENGTVTTHRVSFCTKRSVAGRFEAKPTSR